MKTMAISEFKARALRVINNVARSREAIVITKRGKLLAQVVPHRHPGLKPGPGRLLETTIFPYGEE